MYFVYVAVHLYYVNVFFFFKMSDGEEEETFATNVATLKSMGVVDDEDFIRKVLRQTSNDMEVCQGVWPCSCRINNEEHMFCL